MNAPGTVIETPEVHIAAIPEAHVAVIPEANDVAAPGAHVDRSHCVTLVSLSPLWT